MQDLLDPPKIFPIPGFTQPVSSLTHLLGAGVFAVLSIFLLRRGLGNRVRVACLAVFCFSSVFQLSMSGVYHMLSFETSGRAVLERLDHSAIFILIAGTFTPVHGILFRGIGRWGVLLLIWTAAITGVTLKAIFFHSMSETLGLTLYLVMAWIGGLSGVALWRHYGLTFIKPLLAGGVAYTLGAALDFGRWGPVIPGVIEEHEMFHVAILVGLAFHWRFIWSFADGEVKNYRVS